MTVRIGARLTNADIPAGSAVVQPALNGLIAEVVALLERESKRDMPVGATAVGRGSIAGEVQRGYPAPRGYSIRGIVGSPQSHVSVIDRGRKPGARMPPPAALELWVRRRLGISNVELARSVAFAIARSIQRRGIKGLRIYDKAARRNRGTIDRLFAGAGVKMSVQVTRGRG